MPEPWRSDGALYECVGELKARLLRHAPRLARVALDIRLAIDQRALGTPTSVSRVQGGRLQAKREIRVAAFFKGPPAAMVEMILVHRPAYLKEREHDKAFHALCTHVQGDYHQVELATRLMHPLRSLAIG